MEQRVVRKKLVRRKKPMRYRNFFRILSAILLITTIIFLISLLKIDVLGAKYTSILLIALFAIEAFIFLVLNKRFKVAIKIPFVIFSFVLIGLFCFGTYNLELASSVVSKIVSAAIKEEKYEVYVLENSKYESIEDISKTNLGIYDNGGESLEEAMRLLKKHATFKEEKTYDDIGEMLDEGIDKKIDAFYISNSMIELVKEEYGEQFEQYRLLGDYTVSTKENIKHSNIDVTKEPFLVYVSGIDTYGSIGTVSRSDVNILVAVNPKTQKILLVNTPRDYYVKLHSKKAYDKLTHAGIYGVEESMTTLGDLYVTEVDYYLKVNFSSLIKIVDTLGGITVNSKYNFYYDGFTFHKGQNKLSGEAALAFSRCRKELPGGDVSRGENQEAVIEAMIKKISSPNVISKYTSILNTLSKSFVTNMQEKDIYALAKMQLNDNPKWSISSQNATGSNGFEQTYSAGKTKLYVMKPDEKSVTDVKLALNEILEED